MTERIISDPAAGGWIYEDGKWVWEGQSAGSIQDGDTVGQITTWGGSAWTPDSSLTIDASGNATVGGDVYTYVCKGKDRSGLRFQTPNIIPLNPDGTNANGTIDLGAASARWKDGYFSGTVDAAGFTVNGQPIGGGDSFWQATSQGIQYGGHVMCGSRSEDVDGKTVLSLETARHWSFKQFGTGGSAKLNLQAEVGGNKQFVITSLDAPTVASITFESTSGHIRTIGNVYAANVTASSDERLKDNITTAPVGLIDSLKGREWDWKESGEKGSGVVAQELEQVLPHLVHEDDEGMKSVAYNGLIAYLIEEIKDLKAQVEALK